jgi:xanthine dehydrogenase accessory factor
MPARYVESVLPSLKAWRAEGLATTLVTLFASDGSAPRPLGSQMAIAEDGRAVGSITGGCAEAAIIAEAQQRMARHANGAVRYGAGSPYIDIRLPCGSGIDVWFDTTFPEADLDILLAARARRETACLVIEPLSGRTYARTSLPAVTPSGAYLRRYDPVLRLVLVGKGPIVPLLTQLAAAMDFEVHAFSPEPETLDLAAPFAFRVAPLATPVSFRDPGFDAHTACVSLFHEHDWEPPILALALASPCFYVGALGSQRTQEARVLTLAETGVPAAHIARLHAPVGLHLGGKNPPEIALSILAEIVQVHHRRMGV